MREILFRGKGIDNGEWVFGYLASEYVILERQPMSKSLRNIIVDSSTVGQYTGLKDKNGKMIFEGDVVEWDHSFNDGSEEWHVPVTLGEYFDGENLTVTGWIAVDSPVDSLCEIIGNIHDKGAE